MTDVGSWSSEPEQAACQPVGMFLGTPEIYFGKRIDNTRVVRVADPKRRRELVSLAATLALLFLLLMVYGWQHFKAIDYGYKIEALKGERDAIMESNRALKLEEASLKDLGRIEPMARALGMRPPVTGQVEVMDSGGADTGAPVMAKAAGIMVVSIQ
jgi:cell division protein FtsL